VLYAKARDGPFFGMDLTEIYPVNLGDRVALCIAGHYRPLGTRIVAAFRRDSTIASGPGDAP